jgi:hypothetical protein
MAEAMALGANARIPAEDQKTAALDPRNSSMKPAAPPLSDCSFERQLGDRRRRHRERVFGHSAFAGAFIKQQKPSECFRSVTRLAYSFELRSLARRRLVHSNSVPKASIGAESERLQVVAPWDISDQRHEWDL